MKNRYEIKLYDESMKNELAEMLLEFAEEVYGYDASDTVEISAFILSHHIYVGFVNGNVSGFTSFLYNTNYGLKDCTVANDFIYIKPKYRRTKIMHYFSIQAGAISYNKRMNLEHYYVDGSKSEKFIGRLKGKKIYNAYEYDLESVKEEYDKLYDKIYGKDD